MPDQVEQTTVNESSEDYHRNRRQLFPDPKKRPSPSVPYGLEVLQDTSALYITTYPNSGSGEVPKYAITNEEGAQILVVEEARKRKSVLARKAQEMHFLFFNHRGTTVLTMTCTVHPSMFCPGYEVSVQLRSTGEALGAVRVRNHIFPGEIWDSKGKKRMKIGTNHFGTSRLPCIGICHFSPTKGVSIQARQAVYLRDVETGSTIQEFLIENTPGIHVGIKIPAWIGPDIKAVLLSYLLHYHIWLTNHQEEHPMTLVEERRPEDFLPYLTLEALSQQSVATTRRRKSILSTVTKKKLA